MNNRDEQELIYSGTIVKTKPEGNKSLAIVNVLGRETDWLPVLQQANSFKKSYTPIRVGEQVTVLVNRYVLRSTFNVDCKEPEGANDHTDITEYEDGTRIEYDTNSKALTVNAVGTINVYAKTANVFADEGDVKIDGVSLVHHTHPQNNGNDRGGDAITAKPIKA